MTAENLVSKVGYFHATSSTTTGISNSQLLSGNEDNHISHLSGKMNSVVLDDDYGDYDDEDVETSTSSDEDDEQEQHANNINSEEAYNVNVKKHSKYSCHFVESRRIAKLQSGVARVNCVDCLDRTHVLQFFIGIIIFMISS